MFYEAEQGWGVKLEQLMKGCTYPCQWTYLMTAYLSY
jgi:hypothetical protein